MRELASDFEVRERGFVLYSKILAKLTLYGSYPRLHMKKGIT
jgi:hypothetical protein